MESLLVIGGLFLVLALLGIPVAMSMLLTAAIFFLVIEPGTPITIVATRSISLVSESFTLVAVPLFILAGRLLNDSGMTERLVRFAIAAVGHVRGGIGHAVVLSNVVMAGMSGSATADAAGIGSIMIPALRKAGYSAPSAAALSASAATLGPIIPPSIAMVLYSSLAGISLGQLLLAGLFPGLLMAAFLMVDLYFSSEAGRIERTRFDLRVLLRTARDAIVSLLMPAIILGGMFTGVYTPTEGAAVAVAYALVVGFFIYRTLTIRTVIRALRDSTVTTGAVVFVVMGANVLSWILTSEQAGAALASIFIPFETSPALTLVIIALVTLILGTAMEEVTMLVLMTPILAPIVAQQGIDPVHFGIVFVLATMIGLITPPVGVSMYITCAIADISVGQFTRAVIRPFLALVAATLVIAVWPDFVLVLPRLVFGQGGP